MQEKRHIFGFLDIQWRHEKVAENGYDFLILDRIPITLIEHYLNKGLVSDLAIFVLKRDVKLQLTN